MPNEKKRHNAMVKLFAVSCVLAALYAAGSVRAAMPRFVVTDLWVKDVETGLMWSRDANPAGRLMSWDDASDYIAALNKQKYAGHDDWKLPDLDEFKKFLSAIKAAGRVKSVGGDITVVSILKRLGFHNVQAGDYWSSTKSIYNDTEVWFMNMQYGSRSTANPSLYMCVWPVRWEE